MSEKKIEKDPKKKQIDLSLNVSLRYKKEIIIRNIAKIAFRTIIILRTTFVS